MWSTQSDGAESVLKLPKQLGPRDLFFFFFHLDFAFPFKAPTAQPMLWPGITEIEDMVINMPWD